MKGYHCPPGCARCCEDRGCPVELTIGDMERISAFLDITPRELMERCGEVMWNRIPGSRAFIPSLGLAFPCRFLVAARCRIYQARPLGCRLFPEAPAFREDADRDLYQASGYPCFDRGVSVPPGRARRIQRLLHIQREEARITATVFRNPDYLYLFSPAEIEAIARGLEGCPGMDRNERRRELCLAHIPPALKERVRQEFFKTLQTLKRTHGRVELCEAVMGQ